MEKQYKIVLSFILFVGVSLFANTSSLAQTVTLCIKGEVVDMDDISNLLNGDIALGDELTGTITYDLSTTENNALASVADYYHTTAPNGISVTINGYQFETDPANVDFLAEVLDNFQTTTEDSTYLEDAMVFRSYKNIFSHPSLSTLEESHLAWQLNAASNMALSSVNLPTSINLPDYPWYLNRSVGFTISGTTIPYYYNQFFIRVNITEVSTCVLPESNPNLTAVKVNKPNSSLRAFPNPADDRIIFEAEESMVGAEYSILDCYGVKVLTGTISGNNTTDNISSLNKGQYFILIEGSERAPFKMVKN